jgi:CHASE2 domain-containing sensor protein
VEEMKGWKKRAIVGAFLGFSWSIIGFIISTMPFKKPVWFKILIAFPNFIAVNLGFGSYFIFVGGPLVGIVLGVLIGSIIGFTIEKYKQKGAK